jgi:hypothetical protein
MEFPYPPCSLLLVELISLVQTHVTRPWKLMGWAWVPTLSKRNACTHRGKEKIDLWSSGLGWVFQPIQPCWIGRRSLAMAAGAQMSHLPLPRSLGHTGPSSSYQHLYFFYLRTVFGFGHCSTCMKDRLDVPGLWPVGGSEQPPTNDWWKLVHEYSLAPFPLDGRTLKCVFSAVSIVSWVDKTQVHTVVTS